MTIPRATAKTKRKASKRISHREVDLPGVAGCGDGLGVCDFGATGDFAEAAPLVALEPVDGLDAEEEAEEPLLRALEPERERRTRSFSRSRALLSDALASRCATDRRMALSDRARWYGSSLVDDFPLAVSCDLALTVSLASPGLGSS